MKKGQLATEHLFLIGVLILISLILLYAGAKQLNETHKIAKAEDAVSHLAEKVNEIASLTTGTKDTVWIEIPSKVLDVRLSGKHISLVLLLGNGEQYIMTKDVFTNVVGRINFSIGLQQLFVTKVDETTVKIGIDPMILEVSPQCVSESSASSKSPPLITLYGADFTTASNLYAQNTEISSQYVNVATLTVSSSAIYSVTGTNPTQLSLQTPPNQQSNSVCFHIYATGSPCACEASLGGGGTGEI